MSIADFKNGTPRNHVTAVRDSLIGAVRLRGATGLGRGKVAYQYDDGRTCEHPDGPKHSCSYVDARNRLIPVAEAFARGVVRASGNDDPNNMRFSRLFMGEMTRLWEEKT